MPIEKGIIKVVWVENSSKRIYSKMFESLERADKFGIKKKDYIIFKLIKHKNYKDYEWEILPYGKYKIYSALVDSYKKHGKLISLLKNL